MPAGRGDKRGSGALGGPHGAFVARIFRGVPCGGKTLPLDAVFERFVQKSPLPGMVRLLMQRALSSEWLDALFEAHRQRQDTRELLFSTEVDLMARVAPGPGLMRSRVSATS